MEYRAAIIPEEELALIKSCDLISRNFVMNCATVRYNDKDGEKTDECYHIDIVDVCRKLCYVGAEYNFKKFASIIIKMRNPKAFVRLYKDGKIVSTGCKTSICAVYTINKTISLLNEVLPFKVGAPRGFGNPRMSSIKNIVVTGSVHRAIDLSALQKANKLCTVYRPEEFPGLTLKVAETQGTMLLFSSGKFVITGPCTKLFVFDCLAKCMPVVNPHLGKVITKEEEKEQERKARANISGNIGFGGGKRRGRKPKYKSSVY